MSGASPENNEDFSSIIPDESDLHNIVRLLHEGSFSLAYHLALKTLNQQQAIGVENLETRQLRSLLFTAKLRMTSEPISTDTWLSCGRDPTLAPFLYVTLIWVRICWVSYSGN
jgi:hypothetical protein